MKLKKIISASNSWRCKNGFWVAFCLLFVLHILPVRSSYCEENETLISRAEMLTYPSPQTKGTTALDQPIDPLSYKLGPGDKVEIFLWGNIQAQYNLTVSPEGKLLIPTVGPVKVAGLLLAYAKKHIEAKVLKRFKNIEVNVELTDLRTFKVSVGGAVEYPGIYSANGVTRVSEVIAMAGGFVNENRELNWQRSTRTPLTFPSGIASHRNIIIFHKDGSADTADVLLFEQTGNLRFNYKVSDGDEIFVLLRERGINTYGIFGGVKNPAFYEYSPRDSLRDLINLAHGLTLNVDSTFAELVRFLPDGKTLSQTKISLSEILAGEKQDIKLLPDDRIYIKKIKDFNEKHQVLILGEIKYPGFYAITPDSSFLNQLVERAGGFTEFASLAEAEMTRYTRQHLTDAEFERLKLMEVADMTDLEYEYFKIKSREKRGRVSVDFKELFNGSRQGDIKLRNGDVIEIPRVSEVVNLAGEISNPGLLAYDPQLNYLDYIELAGGFSFRAVKGRVRIIRGSSGEWKKAKKSVILHPGDIIMVPEKKKSNFFKTVRDVIAFTANLATVYLVIREATR